eukprot:scaffold128380_cov38-Tisochrysis_lutea.AAC.1
MHVLAALGPPHGATFARCCSRVAAIFTDPLLWRQYLLAEVELPANVQLEQDARELYRARGEPAAAAPFPGPQPRSFSLALTPLLLLLPITISYSAPQSPWRLNFCATRFVLVNSTSMA